MLVQSILSLLIAVTIWTQVSSRQYVRILQMGDGPNTTLAKAHFEWINITHRHEDSSLVYGVWRITEDLERLEHIETLLYRGREVGGTVNWQYFTTFKMGKNTCDLLAAKDMVYSPIVENTQPTFHCPWKKGDFNINGGTWNLDRIALIHFSTSYQFRVIMNMYKGKDLFGSWQGVVEFEDKKVPHL